VRRRRRRRRRRPALTRQAGGVLGVNARRATPNSTIERITESRKTGVTIDMVNPTLLSSNRSDWRTPDYVLQAAQRALIRIRLDPAAGPGGNPYAISCYTPAQDGLRQLWHGATWLNPPYGRGVTEKWIKKVVIELDASRVTEAIVLLKLAPETRWFRPLHARGAVQCQFRRRLRFDNGKGGATFPSVAVYLGNHPERFIAASQDHGFIYLPAST
jgi:hypothetical protein